MSTYLWLSLGESKEFSALFDKSISKIRLRHSIDSVQWAVFNDVDLTAKWLYYLHTLQVRQLPSLSSNNEMNGGGGRVVDIQIDNLIFTLIFIDMKHLMYNNRIYEIESGLNCPFDETYNAAIDRNGVVTPWG